ncbi:BON domain-containing protein [Paraflavitalea soli]|uniref:BON domain-containing protein n=1 Tax=Paraflavitalea soli TaxID=2315862 RepID=A0A3B7MUM6_9BACT|nr:BON domain-containing protein [Paraflavitalea soli]AXY74171.1 BON domain-containing protein [Paraflavitalea soli]
MKTDAQLQKDVMDELKWHPYLQAAQIGVAAKNGVVTLSGTVVTFGQKLEAERAAKKVAGVKALAEEIQVSLPHSYQKTDSELAEAVLNALKWHSAVQEEKIKVSVEKGHVKLEGTVDWEYQKTSARMAVENLMGVRSVMNSITVQPAVTAKDIEQKIKDSFQRSATIDASHIAVQINDHRVTLNGYVRSLSEKEDAETAAWNAGGITRVESKLEIRLPEYSFED